MAAVLGRDNPEYQHTEQPQEMVEVRGTQEQEMVEVRGAQEQPQELVEVRGAQEQEQEVGAGTRGPQEQEDMDRVRTVQQWPPPVE